MGGPFVGGLEAARGEMEVVGGGKDLPSNVIRKPEGVAVDVLPGKHHRMPGGVGARKLRRPPSPRPRTDLPPLSLSQRGYGLRTRLRIDDDGHLIRRQRRNRGFEGRRGVDGRGRIPKVDGGTAGFFGKVGAADGAGDVGGQPGVDALGVEGVATGRQEAERVVVVELAEAHRALQRTLAQLQPLHIGVKQRRKRLDDVSAQPPVLLQPRQQPPRPGGAARVVEAAAGAAADVDGEEDDEEEGRDEEDDDDGHGGVEARRAEVGVIVVRRRRGRRLLQGAPGGDQKPQILNHTATATRPHHSPPAGEALQEHSKPNQNSSGEEDKTTRGATRRQHARRTCKRRNSHRRVYYHFYFRFFFYIFRTGKKQSKFLELMNQKEDAKGKRKQHLINSVMHLLSREKVSILRKDGAVGMSQSTDLLHP